MLDDLFALFEKLKQRIAQHRDVLSRNEAVTRYALIDPMLTALGWDLSDPAQALVEYNTPGGGIADYALLAGRANPQAVVEAKRLSRPLTDALNQSITYCVGQGIPYFVVTDGEQWAAYETFRPVPVQDKLILTFSLNSETQPAVMKALWLWRGNFEVSSPVAPVTPEPQAQSPHQAAGRRDEVAPAIPEPQVQPPPAGGTSANAASLNATGIPLSTFEAQFGQTPPAALVFPSSIVKPIQRWSDLQVAVVEWLIETGRLTPAHCPLTAPSGAYLVNVTPTRANGNGFGARIQVGELWIDGNNPAPRQLHLAKLILQARGVDPATVLVQA